MLVRCPSCAAKFNVPDDKVAGKRARMKCKKCDGVILIDGTESGSSAGLRLPVSSVPPAPTVQPPAAPAPAAPAATPARTAPPAAAAAAPRRAVQRWEVAEPSGKRSVLGLAELSEGYRSSIFEAGTLVRQAGTTNWLPPYDVPELASVKVAMQSAPPPRPSNRPAQLTFSDETVSLGVAESAALSRQAFAVHQEKNEASGARPASGTDHKVPELQDATGFEEDEVATVVRSLEQLNQLRELAQPPSKQPTLKPPPGSVPAAALPSRPSPLPPQPPAPPAAAAARPAVKRHNPTLLGVPAPAVHSAPGASRPPPAPQATAPIAQAAASVAMPAPPAPHLSATPLPPAPPLPAPSATEATAPRRAADLSTQPPPPAEQEPNPLAEGETEAAPAPAQYSAEWLHASRMPVLSSPAVPSLLDADAPAPNTAPIPASLALPGLAPPDPQAFSSHPPPHRGSSIGWIVALSFLVVVGAGLTGLYFYRPQLFFAGRDRLVAFGHLAAERVGLTPAAPSKVEGPPFDTPSAGAVLERAAQQASSCAEPGGPSGRGRVKVLYQQDGRALNAVVSSPFHETQVGRCLVGIFKSTQVPAFGGEPVIVSKTFTVR